MMRCNTLPLSRERTMYTAQANAHGNIIVCKGSDVRNSYRIVFTGTYAECLQFKAINL